MKVPERPTPALQCTSSGICCVKKKRSSEDKWAIGHTTDCESRVAPFPPSICKMHLRGLAGRSCLVLSSHDDADKFGKGDGGGRDAKVWPICKVVLRHLYGEGKGRQRVRKLSFCFHVPLHQQQSRTHNALLVIVH